MGATFRPAARGAGKRPGQGGQPCVGGAVPARTLPLEAKTLRAWLGASRSPPTPGSGSDGAAGARARRGGPAGSPLAWGVGTSVCGPGRPVLGPPAAASPWAQLRGGAPGADCVGRLGCPPGPAARYLARAQAGPWAAPGAPPGLGASGRTAPRPGSLDGLPGPPPPTPPHPRPPAGSRRLSRSVLAPQPGPLLPRAVPAAPPGGALRPPKPAAPHLRGPGPSRGACGCGCGSGSGSGSGCAPGAPQPPPPGRSARPRPAAPGPPYRGGGKFAPGRPPRRPTPPAPPAPPALGCGARRRGPSGCPGRAGRPAPRGAPPRRRARAAAVPALTAGRRPGRAPPAARSPLPAPRSPLPALAAGHTPPSAAGGARWGRRGCCGSGETGERRPGRPARPPERGAAQRLSWACLPGAWGAWREGGAPGPARPLGTTPSAPGPARPRAHGPPSLRLPAGHRGDRDASGSTCKQRGVPGMEAAGRAVGGGSSLVALRSALPPPSPLRPVCARGTRPEGPGRSAVPRASPPPPPGRKPQELRGASWGRRGLLKLQPVPHH
ncbi:basic proline-rich protein-like [Canis lupus dingo]|uniref:basic proline-rich protein-like n=1 Tax=Canis lupus dingo TaxID=286419 RepID=UPI0020C45508|nr:basic proline-rich protein-like [Canis lupus dingo]